jgi:hypothetical protein
LSVTHTTLGARRSAFFPFESGVPLANSGKKLANFAMLAVPRHAGGVVMPEFARFVAL